MLYNSSTNPFSLNVLEKVINLDDGVSNSPGSLRCNMPKLMPNIGIGIPKVVITSLSDGCFCNSSECKPQVSKVIQTQNFITVNAYGNREVTYKSKPPVVNRGDYWTVEVVGGNLRKIWLTDKEW